MVAVDGQNRSALCLDRSPNLAGGTKNPGCMGAISNVSGVLWFAWNHYTLALRSASDLSKRAGNSRSTEHSSVAQNDPGNPVMFRKTRQQNGFRLSALAEVSCAVAGAYRFWLERSDF